MGEHRFVVSFRMSHLFSALKLRDAFFSHVSNIDNFFQQLVLALDMKMNTIMTDFGLAHDVLHAVNTVYMCMIGSAITFRQANRNFYLPDEVSVFFYLWGRSYSAYCLLRVR